jgi:hypothetical protein
LAHLFRKSKNYGKEESGKRILECRLAEKEGAFFGKGCCEKCTGMKQQKKRRLKRVKLRCQ